jgi:hypothetical protein
VRGDRRAASAGFIPRIGRLPERAGLSMDFLFGFIIGLAAAVIGLFVLEAMQ